MPYTWCGVGARLAAHAVLKTVAENSLPTKLVLSFAGGTFVS